MPVSLRSTVSPDKNCSSHDAVRFIGFNSGAKQTLTGTWNCLRAEVLRSTRVVLNLETNSLNMGFFSLRKGENKGLGEIRSGSSVPYKRKRSISLLFHHFVFTCPS